MSYNPPTYGHCLLEEWPDHDQHPKLKKRVRFSKYSEVRFYHMAARPQEKSYSKKEIKKFKAQAIFQVSSLEKLISRTNMPTGNAIHGMIEFGAIKHDDLLGLEHLVTSKAREEFAEVRRTHLAVVLRAQYLLREKFADNSDDELAAMLSKVSIISSSRTFKKAMLRARMSLIAEKQDIDDSNSGAKAN